MGGLWPSVVLMAPAVATNLAVGRGPEPGPGSPCCHSSGRCADGQPKSPVVGTNAASRASLNQHAHQFHFQQAPDRSSKPHPLPRCPSYKPSPPLQWTLRRWLTSSSLWSWRTGGLSLFFWRSPSPPRAAQQHQQRPTGTTLRHVRN